MGSPVPLSSEAVDVITRLRNMKVCPIKFTLCASFGTDENDQDEDEDWSRWRDVVFRAKAALSPPGLRIKKQPPNKRRRGKAEFVEGTSSPTTTTSEATTPPPENTGSSAASESIPEDPVASDSVVPPLPPPVQLTTEEAAARISAIDAQKEVSELSQSENLYCPECYLPLHPDPKPERLYIFLHALRYTTSLGMFETEMPEWTAEGWVWDRA